MISEQFFISDIIFCNNKELLAQPGRTLIDDTPQNVEDWIRCGGTGILWEQPWNTQTQ